MWSILDVPFEENNAARAVIIKGIYRGVIAVFRLGLLWCDREVGVYEVRAGVFTLSSPSASESPHHSGRSSRDTAP